MMKGRLVYKYERNSRGLQLILCGIVNKRKTRKSYLAKPNVSLLEMAMTVLACKKKKIREKEEEKISNAIW